MRQNKKILILTQYYLPGYKGGGPIRTVANMLQALSKEFHFSLITSDRDLGDPTAYPNITPNTWQKIDTNDIIYLSKENFVKNLYATISHHESKVINLNSFFSFKFSILPLIIWRFLKPGMPIIIGPRGEFSSGALIIKSLKKKIFIGLVKTFNIYKDVIWHASTKHEESDIHRVMGKNVKVRIAIDIAQTGNLAALRPLKEDNLLRIVFVSRISTKKNLLGAINLLRHVNARIIFDVYGPKEDESYWRECQNAAEHLPQNINFNYCGILHPDEISDRMAKYDLFLFPTLGENFGHVIAEALSAGLPILISDTTPWNNLEEKNIGWNIPLNQPEKYVKNIESCYKKTPEEYDVWRKHIRKWAIENIGNQDAIEQNRQIFMNLK